METKKSSRLMIAATFLIGSFLMIRWEHPGGEPGVLRLLHPLDPVSPRGRSGIRRGAILRVVRVPRAIGSRLRRSGMDAEDPRVVGSQRIQEPGCVRVLIG